MKKGRKEVNLRFTHREFLSELEMSFFFILSTFQIVNKRFFNKHALRSSNSLSRVYSCHPDLRMWFNFTFLKVIIRVYENFKILVHDKLTLLSRIYKVLVNYIYKLSRRRLHFNFSQELFKLLYVKQRIFF